MSDSFPILGDPGYLDHPGCLEAAFKAGHVTEEERRQTRLLHLACFRAHPAAGEPATLDDVDALIAEGVLIERDDAIVE